MTGLQGSAVLKAFGLAVAVAATACVPGYSVHEGGEPTAISGRFGGEPAPNDGGNACVWLTRPDGTRTYLLLFGEVDPVRFEPLRLVDDRGQIIAKVGDTVTAVGPRGALGDNGCGKPEMTFVVDTLTGPGGVWRDVTALESFVP